MRHLFLIGLLVLSLPFWLPTSLGGDTSYFFVLTTSMEGTLDPGTFVVLRRGDSYQIGDVVGYRLDLGGGKGAIILHRIVKRLPEGRYLTKGNASPKGEVIEGQQITGRMALALPGLGFLPGAFRQAPFLLGGLLLSLLFVLRWPKEAPLKVSPPRSHRSLFLLAFPLVVLSFLFASVGLAAFLGKEGMLLLLFGLLGVTRVVEARGGNPRLLPLVEAGYLVAMILAVSSISFPEVVSSFRAGFQ